MKRALSLVAAAVLLGGCATSYNMTLMPRDSGKLYSGFIEDAGRGEGRVSVTIDDKAYEGTWLQVTPERSTGFLTGFGFGFGGRRGGFGLGVGSNVTMDNPEGGLSTALLQARDGSGLRCEFRGGYGRGGGHCRDDRGREYDVQLRAKA